MDVGSIYLHEKFRFSDGQIGKKLFLVVNSPVGREDYLVCKTTSKARPPYRIKQQGCSAPKKNYFMFFSRDDWFNQDTWIQFDELYEFSAGRLLKDKFGGQAKYQADLKPVNIRAVLNCILKSDDIAGKHLDSIRQALKKLKAQL